MISSETTVIENARKCGEKIEKWTQAASVDLVGKMILSVAASRQAGSLVDPKYLQFKT
jgi:hypothetical protein